MIADATKLKEFISPSSPFITIDVTVAYWRKANAIHQWFVRNIQEGKDECQRSYVDREKLLELINDCTVALDNPDRAKEVLPTQNGFFFGDTEYDEYYNQTLENTIKQLKRVLEIPENVGFYYHASW